jgi:hypothetical protein
VALVVCIGYLAAERSFAYVGIPALNLYVGEAMLVAALCLRETRQAFKHAVDWLVRPGRFHGLACVLTLFLGYGVFQVLRGFVDHYRLLTALKNFPFNYYALFLVLGVWLGRRSPEFLRRLLHGFAVVNAIYGPLTTLFLGKLPLTFPGSGGVPLFKVGTGSGIAIIGLLAFPLEQKYRKWTWVLILANAFVLLAEQQRAEWLGFIAALVVWSLLARKIRTLAIGAVAVIGLLALVGLLGIKIPGAAGRSGSVSLGSTIGRAVAPIDPNLAAKYTQDAKLYKDTTTWRTTWWSAIWQSSRQDTNVGMFGHGYGYNLSSLTDVPVSADTRTPHNVFFYALGYTGWIGVGLFVLLWGTLVNMLWRVYRITGNGFGLAFFAAALCLGLFGNWFETPFGAAPTYFIVGVAIAPLFSAMRRRYTAATASL